MLPRCFIPYQPYGVEVAADAVVVRVLAGDEGRPRRAAEREGVDRVRERRSPGRRAAGGRSASARGRPPPCRRSSRRGCSGARRCPPAGRAARRRRDDGRSQRAERHRRGRCATSRSAPSLDPLRIQATLHHVSHCVNYAGSATDDATTRRAEIRRAGRRPRPDRGGGDRARPRALLRRAHRRRVMRGPASAARSSTATSTTSPTS